MKKRHTPEQIVAKLRQADVERGKGLRVPEVCKQLGISEQTYCRWRTKYGGMDPVMAKQLKEMEKENATFGAGSSGWWLTRRWTSRCSPTLQRHAVQLVAPERRRRTVETVRDRLGHENVSGRRACRSLGQPRSPQRYRLKQVREGSPVD